MQHFKIINIHTNKVINLNYTELQDFMRINRKNFFYNYTIQRIEKTNILKNIIAFLIVSCGSIALLMLGGLLDKI